MRLLTALEAVEKFKSRIAESTAQSITEFDSFFYINQHSAGDTASDAYLIDRKTGCIHSIQFDEEMKLDFDLASGTYKISELLKASR